MEPPATIADSFPVIVVLSAVAVNVIWTVMASFEAPHGLEDPHRKHQGGPFVWIRPQRGAAHNVRPPRWCEERGSFAIRAEMG